MDAQHVHALNELLEDERASVEILIALTAMATDSLERQALTVMGGQAAQACVDVREVLAQRQAEISQKVGTAAGRVVAPDRLDERFSAYAELQRQMTERIASLAQDEPDADTQAMLATLQAMHLAHAAWVAQRADEFVASRRQAEDAAALAHAAAHDAAHEAAPEGAGSASGATAAMPKSEPAPPPAGPTAALPQLAADREGPPVVESDPLPGTAGTADPVEPVEPVDPPDVAPLAAEPPVAEEADALAEQPARRARRSRTRVLEDVQEAHDER